MKKPNFFIVGAAKAGTSSLWEYLKQNQQVFMPPDALDKEPAFFSPLKRRRTFSQYINLFKDADERHLRVGEASTAYLTDPMSAGLINEFNPTSKIIIILRNPADRAYSAYRWMVQEGYEYALSFRKALDLEHNRSRKRIPNFWEPEYYWNYMYFSAGLYSNQVKRYLSLFGENVLIIKFENFISELEREYKKICSFLDIPLNSINSNLHNASKDVYSSIIQFFLRKLSTQIIIYRKRYFNYQYNSKNQRDWILNIGIRQRKPEKEKIDFQLRKYLLKKYHEDIDKLSSMSGINFKDWYNDTST